MSQIGTWLPYIGLLLVYALGANLDIMAVDAAQYASISLEMFKSGEFLQVVDRHEDYLDKPPLLFWVSALSMKLLGVGSWQYKLPSILFSLIGLFSTFKLGQRLYSTQIGHHAAMILGSSLAIMMTNNDIKTDTILVAAIIFSIWMLVSYIETKQLKFIIGAAFGIAAAMLTKGPIGLMMPALAIGGHLVLKKNWIAVIDWRWLLLLLLVAVLLIPMSIGLYQQYGVDGLKFYFWTQSFGRITGENSWKNDTTPLYFTHVFLWSFLPWVLLAIGALIQELKTLFKPATQNQSEFYLISGIVLVWIALSLSKFKLPHYIFVVYPLISILCAKYINGLKNFIPWAWTQLSISGVSILLMATLLLYCFPDGGWVVPLILLVFFGAAVLFFFTSYRASQIVVPSFILSIAIGLGLNLHFYPQILPYQANAKVGQWMTENDVPHENLIGFSTGGRALDFYAGGIIPWEKDVASTIDAISPGVIVYATEERYEELKNHGQFPTKEMVFKDFEVQNLTIEFLNPKTREQVVKKKYLLFY